MKFHDETEDNILRATRFFLPDKLHPSAAGYAVWTQVVAGTVKKVLGV